MKCNENCVSKYCILIISKHEATRAYISFSQTPSVKSVTRPLCMRQRAKENHKAEIQEETFNPTVAISKSIERTSYSGCSPIPNSK
jgi:hypothetical protein